MSTATIRHVTRPDRRVASTTTVSQSHRGSRKPAGNLGLRPADSGAASRGARGVEGELVDRERETRRAGWRLMRGTLGSQRSTLALGVLAGVSWTAAKISVPLLAAGAIDNGILPGNNQAILVYSLVIVAVGVVQGLSTGFRRYSAFRIA